MADKFIFEIDGVNMVPYLKAKGFKWTRYDCESDAAGETMDWVLDRDRIKSKYKLVITCAPLTQSQARKVLRTIYPEWVMVTYQDPQNGIVTVKMHSNNVPAVAGTVQSDGTVLWDGIEFPLIPQDGIEFDLSLD